MSEEGRSSLVSWSWKSEMRFEVGLGGWVDVERGGV